MNLKKYVLIAHNSENPYLGMEGLSHDDVTVVTMGIGKERARATLSELALDITKEGVPVKILLTGTCGSTNFPVGTIITQTNYCRQGSVLRYRLRSVEGYIKQVDEFVTKENRDRLVNHLDSAFDMESQEVREFVHNLPVNLVADFTIAKVVSDGADLNILGWEDAAVQMRPTIYKIICEYRKINHLSFLEAVEMYKDFPRRNVSFVDIFPALSQENLLRIGTWVENEYPQCVLVAPELRGLSVATAVSTEIGCKVVPVRRAGKLPGDTVKISTKSEYSEVELEFRELDFRDATDKQLLNVVLFDDILATGGTAESIIKTLNGRKVVTNIGTCTLNVVAALFLTNVPSLRGEARLEQLVDVKIFNKVK